MIPARLLAALGVDAANALRTESGWRIRVDDVDRRYRDAIKAGGAPFQPPRDGARRGERVARLRVDGIVVEVVSGGGE